MVKDESGSDDSDEQMDEQEEDDSENSSDTKAESSDEDTEEISAYSPSSSDSSTTSSPESSSTSSSDSSEEEEDEDDEYVPEGEKAKLQKSNKKWKLLSEKNVFRKEWLQHYDWVSEDPQDNKSAVCWKCNTTLKAHKGILESHSKCKKHLKSIGVIVDDPPKKEEKQEARAPNYTNVFGCGPQDQFYDHVGLFTESPTDAAHQQVTSLIDKLVEKYQKERVQKLKIQNHMLLQLNVERALMVRGVNDRRLELQKQRELFSRELKDTKFRCLQLQHEEKLRAMEDERDKKIKAVEQELMFAKQEYEKKVRLLDSQICNMK